VPYRRTCLDSNVAGALMAVDSFHLLTKPVCFSDEEKIQILLKIIDDVFSDTLHHRDYITDLLKLKKIFQFFNRDIVFKNCAMITDLIKDFKDTGVESNDMILAVHERWANAKTPI